MSQPVAPETVAQEVAPVAPTATRNYNFQPYNPFPNQYGGGGGEVPPVAKTTGGPGATIGGPGGQSGVGGGGRGGDTGSGAGGGAIVSSPSAAPEPQSWALLLCGVGMIGGMLRARRNGRAAV